MTGIDFHLNLFVLAFTVPSIKVKTVQDSAGFQIKFRTPPKDPKPIRRVVIGGDRRVGSFGCLLSTYTTSDIGPS